MSHHTHKRYLKISACLVMSFAPVFFLATMAGASALPSFVLGLILPPPGSGHFVTQDVRFISALSGGFLLGWGLLIWHLATDVYDAAPEAVRRAVLIGYAGWFVLDSTGSVLAGVPVNVASNAVLLAALVGPLWRPVSVEAAV